MAFTDLRAYLAQVQEIGELQVVRGADTKSEIGAITEITAWSPEHPMILFEDIPGVRPGFRVAVHGYDSYHRMRLLYGFPDGMGRKELVRWWKDRLAAYQPVPPVEVTSGPVLENVQEGGDVDLGVFPAPVWHQGDAGPYLATGGTSVLRDPDTGELNVGCYRGMLYDRNTIGHHLAAGHHGQVIRDKYFARGQNCPILVTLGHEVSMTLAGAENLGYGQSELEYGGFLRGAPYEVITGPRTGLPMLAAAEVVLEGEILRPEAEPKRIEGPWGEGLGYYAAGFPQPPVRIHAVYYRNDPIIMGEPTLRFRNSGAAGSFSRAARRWHMLERSGLEGIAGVGQVGPFLVIAVKQYYSGQAMRIADFAMTGLADRPPRYLVLVDDDIDPTNRALVEWAINTRVDPAAQVHIQRDRWCNAVNPAGLTPDKRAIEDYSLGTMIIDACKPYRWREHWDRMFKESDIEEGLRQQVAQKWAGALGPIMNVPKPL
ncbi:MAG TPA: UbiD family decarboxylase [Trebonia sp.]|nr:UbiD family decarboxylase [Trebonia sp.]